MTRPRTPTTPARLATMTPVGLGAPAWETEEVVVAEDAEDADVIVMLEGLEGVEDVEDAVAATEDSLAAIDPRTEVAEAPIEEVVTSAKVGLKVLKYSFTLAGSDEYHAGVDPAWNSLAKTLADVGFCRSLITEAGMAVSRTDRIETGGNMLLRTPTTLSMLDN